MHPTLIAQIAHDEIAERVQAAQRERLARSAETSTRRNGGRLGSAIHRVRAGLSTWRMRNQLGAIPAPQCVDCRGAA
jgi:hypothetical protein